MPGIGVVGRKSFFKYLNVAEIDYFHELIGKAFVNMAHFQRLTGKSESWVDLFGAGIEFSAEANRCG